MVFAVKQDSKILAVFEAPVDLMSFLSLMAEKPGAWENPNCISLGGSIREGTYEAHRETKGH